MAFQPRQFAQIRDDMINYIKSRTTLTDFNVGSRIRTIIEAVSLEDDEQYFQMVQLLDAFNIQKASGTDLDDRAKDYDETRLQPSTSAGSIVITNTVLPTSTLLLNFSIGVLALTVVSSASFPSSGFPYTIRVGEGTTNVEDVVCSAINFGTNILTTAATINGHNAGDRVSFVSGTADQNLVSGIQGQTKAIGNSAPIKFITTEKGTLVNGNYFSTPVKGRAVVAGSTGNVGTGTIVAFTAGPPFPGAGITNIKAFGGGRDLETDPDFRGRVLSKVQLLTKATVLAVRECVKGVTDPVTFQTVTSSSLLERFSTNEVIVYIDDGTGFTPDQVTLARTTVKAFTAAGSGTIQSAAPIGVSDFPKQGYVIISTEDPAEIEVIKYSSVDYATGIFTLSVVTAHNHDLGDEIALVDTVSLSAEASQNFFKVHNFPVIRNSQRVWLSSGGAFTLQILDTNYKLNKGNGQLEIIGPGVPLGSEIVANYSYYTGLIASAQEVIEGSIDDSVNFPGFRASGVQVVVETPNIRRVALRSSISVQPQFDETTIALQVQQVQESYISGLGIGKDVILAELVALSMGVSGMTDIVFISPLTNLIVLEDELPLPFAADGSSLIQVT